MRKAFAIILATIIIIPFALCIAALLDNNFRSSLSNGLNNTFGIITVQTRQSLVGFMQYVSVDATIATFFLIGYGIAVVCSYMIVKKVLWDKYKAKPQTIVNLGLGNVAKEPSMPERQPQQVPAPQPQQGA